MNDLRCPYCGILCATFEARAGHMSVCTEHAVIKGPIWVSPDGSDTEGFGTQAAPYRLLSKALNMVDINHPNIFMLPGEYPEPTMVVWPNITGITVVGMGAVSISNLDASAEVILINPTYTAASFEASLEKVNIAADTQIGLKIANDHMSKKLNVYLDKVTAEMDTSGDSIDMTNAVTSQAIRIYANDCEFEGLVHITTANAGGRYRFKGCTLDGGLTSAGAVKAEVTLRDTLVLTGGLSVATEQLLNTLHCGYRTDADPSIYTELADAFDTA